MLEELRCRCDKWKKWSETWRRCRAAPRASVDPDLGFWALIADTCAFLTPGTSNAAQSWVWGSAPSCGSLGATHLFPPQQPEVPPVPSLPATEGSCCCLMFFPQDSPEAGGEREEEQAFLVSLYKFMKERHTPIQRVPHLGFKQSASLGCRQGGGAPGRGPPPRQGIGEHLRSG